MLEGSITTTNFDAWRQASFDRAEPYSMTWLRQMGAKLRKGCRQDVTVLADGRARLTVDYQSLPDLLAVLTEIDTIMAMTQEGGVQAARKDGPWASRRPPKHP